MTVMFSFLCIFLVMEDISALLLPVYKVNLTNNENFDIGDWRNEGDIIGDDDEMINVNDIKAFKVDDDKFNRLKEFVTRYKRNDFEKSFDYVNPFYNDTIYDTTEPVPWAAGTYTGDGNGTRAVRQVNETDDDDYNYEDLKREYDMEIKEVAKLNDTFNFTSVEHKKIELIKEVVDFKTPPNCTGEETRGIGIKAVKCLFKDLKHATTTNEKKRIILTALKITSVWIGVYAAIAIILWCQKGWCCCCCPCKFCHPREQIDEAKKFMLDNPPGVYNNSAGETITYKFNPYEAYTYNELREELITL